MLDYLVAVFLSVILIFTVLKEWALSKEENDALVVFLGRFPLLIRFIPIWSFFAPVPGMSDYFLCIRVISPEGKLGKWQQISDVSQARGAYSFIWNPNKMTVKAFLDLSDELVRISKRLKDVNQICISMPYLHLLSYVTSFVVNQTSHSLPCKIQFMILTRFHLEPAEAVFLSECHPLSDRGLV